MEAKIARGRINHLKQRKCLSIIFSRLRKLYEDRMNPEFNKKMDEAKEDRRKNHC